MKIQSLSYLLVETTDLQEWDDYAKDVVGLMKNDSLSDDQNLYLRMDKKSFRFHITTGDSQKYLAAGFSLSDKASFDDAKSELDRANIEYEELGDEIAKLRCVEECIGLNDPAGNRLELSYGSEDSSEPFVSTQDIKGFITEGLGFGHVVFAAQIGRASCRERV